MDYLILEIALAVTVWLLPMVYTLRYRAGLRDGKRMTSPRNKYEVVVMPISEGLIPIETRSQSRIAQTAALVLAKNDAVVCFAVKNGYQVVIRNTIDGWYRRDYYDRRGDHWQSFRDDTDTLIGYVSMDDPDFQGKLVELEDKARTHIAVLETVA